MPIRPGDTVQFIGPGPDPSPEKWDRHDPDGAPMPGEDVSYSVITEGREAKPFGWPAPG